MSWFKKIFNSIVCEHFLVNHIYKINPTNQSHVKTHYYVEIIETGYGYIITNIHEYHSLVIDKTITNENWSYHIPRMEYVGSYKDYKHLLFNQNNLLHESDEQKQNISKHNSYVLNRIKR